MVKHVGVGVPGMSSDAEQVAQMRSNVPAEDREDSRIPRFGAGTGHSSAKSRGGRKTHSQKERLDLQHSGFGESSMPARQPSSDAGNEILEQHGVGVAVFNEPGATRKYQSDEGNNEEDEYEYGRHASRCPYGGAQALQRSMQQGDDRSMGEDVNYDSQRQDEGSDPQEMSVKDSDLDAMRKVSVPYGDDDSMPMVSPPTSQLNTAAPYTTTATMKSSQFNSNDPDDLSIRRP